MSITASPGSGDTLPAQSEARVADHSMIIESDLSKHPTLLPLYRQGN
jgi:hypothetical protein